MNNLVLFLFIEGMVRSLLITELLELTVALILPSRNKHDLILTFLLNAVTNPLIIYLDFLFKFHVPSILLWVASLEFGVWLSESLIYKKCLNGNQNPFLYSLILNAASYLGGVLYSLFIK